MVGDNCEGFSRTTPGRLPPYAEAGCQRVHFWPLGEERRQIELLAAEVMPQIRAAG